MLHKKTYFWLNTILIAMALGMLIYGVMTTLNETDPKFNWIIQPIYFTLFGYLIGRRKFLRS